MLRIISRLRACLVWGDDGKSEKNKRRKSDIKVDRPHRTLWEVGVGGGFPVILNFSDSEEKTFEGIISS